MVDATTNSDEERNMGQNQGCLHAQLGHAAAGSHRSPRLMPGVGHVLLRLANAGGHMQPLRAIARSRVVMRSLHGLAMVACLLVMLVQIGATRAFADPPTGDTCSFPIPVPDGFSWEYSGDLGPYANDYDPGIPGPSCTGSAAPGKDVVFSVEVQCGEWLDVYMDPADFDGALYIVTDCTDPTGTCLSGSDVAGAGEAENAGLHGLITQTCYVIVDAHDPGAGGAFHISFNLGPLDIPPGACCFPDGHCEVRNTDICREVGGLPVGPCVPCDPNPCDPTPIREQTWGALRARYR